MTTALERGLDSPVVAQVDAAESAMVNGLPLAALRIFCEIERDSGARANQAVAAARRDGITVSYYRRTRYLGPADAETLPDLRAALRLAAAAEADADTPLVMLGSLIKAQALANTAAGEAVRMARSHSTTWDVIAEVAGLGSRDGAQKRWREAVTAAPLHQEGPAGEDAGPTLPVFERPLQ